MKWATTEKKFTIISPSVKQWVEIKQKHPAGLKASMESKTMNVAGDLHVIYIHVLCMIYVVS